MRSGDFIIMCFLCLVISCTGKDKVAGSADNTVKATTAGGTYIFGNGLVLEMEAGSLDQDTSITLDPLLFTEIEEALTCSTLVEQSFYGGIKAEPAGLVFNKPVRITMPVEDIDDPETLFLHGTINTDTGTLILSDTDITIDAAGSKAVLEVTGFSKHFIVKAEGQEWLATFDPSKEWDKCRNWNGRDENGNLRGTETVEDDCRCGRRRYTTEDLDYVNSQGCQSVRSILNVEFLDCETPTYWIYVMSEETNCSRQYPWHSDGHGSLCYDAGDDWNKYSPWPAHNQNESCRKFITSYEHTIICKEYVYYGYDGALIPPVARWTYLYYDNEQYEQYRNTACTGEGQTRLYSK